MKIALATQPENYRKLIKRNLDLYKRGFKHVFLVALLLSIIAFTPRILALFANPDTVKATHFLNLHNLWYILIDFACLILFTALLWRIRCVITDTHESIGDDLKIAFRKLPYIFVASLLQTFIVIAVIISCSLLLFYIYSQLSTAPALSLLQIILLTIAASLQLILTLYILYSLYFYLPIILIENNGILNSLRKSSFLVWGNWWRTFQVQITPWIIYIVLLIVLQMLHIRVDIYFIESNSPTFLATLIHILILALFLPWAGSLMLVQLNDLELRKVINKN
jgi:hypothetical protein